jgi:hypothetical protein
MKHPQLPRGPARRQVTPSHASAAENHQPRSIQRTAIAREGAAPLPHVGAEAPHGPVGAACAGGVRPQQEGDVGGGEGTEVEELLICGALRWVAFEAARAAREEPKAGGCAGRGVAVGDAGALGARVRGVGVRGGTWNLRAAQTASWSSKGTSRLQSAGGVGREGDGVSPWTAEMVEATSERSRRFRGAADAT